MYIFQSSFLYTIVRYSSYLVIWDLEKSFESLELSKYMLSKNIKGRLEWPLASAYVPYLYKLYRSHISDWRTVDLKDRKPLEDSKVCCH